VATGRQALVEASFMLRGNPLGVFFRSEDLKRHPVKLFATPGRTAWSPRSPKTAAEMTEKTPVPFSFQFDVPRGGRALARFTFQGFSAYADMADSDSELLRFGDSNVPYESGAVARAFNACTDARVRDRRAINFYIYNSYSPEKRFQDDTSHGTRNSNRPYLLIDWTRLDNRGQNPGAHEMGHAFGLEHVGVPGATMGTETNIMTSVGEGFGSGGTRNLAFTEAQAAVILYHAKRTHQRLGLSEPEP
jgi:hypothetical protein